MLEGRSFFSFLGLAFLFHDLGELRVLYGGVFYGVQCYGRDGLLQDPVHPNPLVGLLGFNVHVLHLFFCHVGGEGVWVLRPVVARMFVSGHVLHLELEGSQPSSVPFHSVWRRLGRVVQAG